MRDIFKPGELKQNTINIKKRLDANIEEPKVSSGSQPTANAVAGNKDIKSTLILTSNRRSASAKIMLLTLIIIIAAIGFFALYYFINLNRPNNLENVTQGEGSDLDKFEKNLNEIESSSENLDTDKQEIEYPTIDFNVNL